MASRQDALTSLLNSAPDHVYSEAELDAIEAIDPDLAMRIARAQVLAERNRPAVEASKLPPVDAGAVARAVEEARRILSHDGGDIELVGIEGRTVRVRLKGACVGCPRSALDLRNVVERLIRSHAQGVVDIQNQ